MERYELMMRSTQYAWGAFIFAFGACVGSLINVLVYRMPLGLDVVTPSSRCPRCSTKLRWNDNIPILGWLFLRGRCRYCRTPISPEYPLVETLAALLFLGLFVLWYTLPTQAVFLGLDWGALRPEWVRLDGFDRMPRTTWPVFTVYIALVGSLLAMTLVDAKTFTIPLAIPWTATVIALLFHTGHALAVDLEWMRWPIIRFSDWPWAIPTYNSWGVVFGSLGGVIGIVGSMLLLKLGVITRSFGDQYEAWEKAELAKRPGAEDPEADDDPLSEPDFSAPYAILLTVGITLVTGTIGAFIAPATGYPGWYGLMAGLLLGPWVSAALQRIRAGATGASGSPDDDGESDAELWIRYPHARAEMVREMAFLALPVILFYVGFAVIGPRLSEAAGWSAVPLTLQVLSGVLLGYLIGGAVVWAIRIFGSLAFGKEAMGLGDAHLMAAVGACTGWIDATIAFFGAAFVGIYWTITSLISGRVDRAMPYGPYLAVATVIVVVGKPAIEAGLSELTGASVSLP